MNSCDKERSIKATIVKDCTGTYLRFNTEDYKVCNIDKTTNFTHGQIVKVTFEKMDECNGSGNFEIICELYHPYESWAEVIKIKQQ